MGRRKDEDIRFTVELTEEAQELSVEFLAEIFAPFIKARLRKMREEEILVEERQLADGC